MYHQKALEIDYNLRYSLIVGLILGRESANHSKSETLKKKSDKWFHFMYSGASLLAGRQSVYFKMVSSLRLLCSYDRTILLYFEGMTIEKNVLSQHAETIKVYDRNNKRIGEGLFKSAAKSEQPLNSFTSYQKIYKLQENSTCRLQNGNESRNENFYA